MGFLVHVQPRTFLTAPFPGEAPHVRDRGVHLPLRDACSGALVLQRVVAEAPWSVAEWAVALRFDIPRATVPVLVLG